jgi:GDPmannose 4,6-dehydratase
MKKILITGVSGQDGAYLSKLMISKGYKVYGAYRRTSDINFWRLKYLGVYENPNLVLIELDLTDISSVLRCLEISDPEMVFNLAAQSFVGYSFNSPIATSQITGLGVVNVLEAIRIFNKKIKFYQASSSEMYGKVNEIPQSENTKFYPRSPYGVAKVFGHWMTVNYRESYDMFAVSGILFNHESPLRGIEFVTRKITDGVAKIKNNTIDKISLGNLYAKRDWGHAKDYVNGMFLMLQQENPDDYVLASGETHTIKHFVELSFNEIGIDLIWKGKGLDECGIDSKTNKVLVDVDKKYYRPNEVDLLIGDPSKAKSKLGWNCEYDLKKLVNSMMTYDLNLNP